MTKRDDLLALTTLILTVGSSSIATDLLAAQKKDAPSIECYGINKCSGTNSCGIGDEQIAAANKAFANKFAKSQTMDCAGNSSCSAKKGHLAWVSKATVEKCFKSSGFIFEKDAAGKLQVKDKNGIKNG